MDLEGGGGGFFLIHLKGFCNRLSNDIMQSIVLKDPFKGVEQNLHDCEFFIVVKAGGGGCTRIENIDIYIFFNFSLSY